VTLSTWYVVTVHNQETEAIRTIELGATTRTQAAEIAVQFVFRELGWHHVWCHPVRDVEQVSL